MAREELTIRVMIDELFNFEEGEREDKTKRKRGGQRKGLTLAKFCFP